MYTRREDGLLTIRCHDKVCFKALSTLELNCWLAQIIVRNLSPELDLDSQIAGALDQSPMEVRSVNDIVRRMEILAEARD